MKKQVLLLTILLSVASLSKARWTYDRLKELSKSEYYVTSNVDQNILKKYLHPKYRGKSRKSSYATLRSLIKNNYYTPYKRDMKHAVVANKIRQYIPQIRNDLNFIRNVLQSSNLAIQTLERETGETYRTTKGEYQRRYESKNPARLKSLISELNQKREADSEKLRKQKIESKNFTLIQDGLKWLLRDTASLIKEARR